MTTFRAIKEVWGTSTSSLLEASSVVTILTEIAEEKNIPCNDGQYGDKLTFWVEQGSAFLNALKELGDADFEQWGEPLLEADPEVENPAIVFVQNLRFMADQWSGSIDEDGSLRFYLDY